MGQRCRWIASVAVVACLGPGAAAGDEPATEPTPQPRIAAFTADALGSLKRSADFLAAQKAYRFGADVSYDVLQPTGQMLEFGGRRDYLVRRPDRVRIQAVGRDGQAMELFFDGRSILIDVPGEDAYVQVEKPGTLYAALDYLVEDLQTPSPLSEFLSQNFAADVEGKIESGFYVQHVDFGEEVCEQLAFRTARVDFQLWIRAGDEPLPCRLVVTYKLEAGQPQFTAQFRDWDLSPEVDDELFVFTPPESAERIQVQALAQHLREQRESQ